MAHELKLYCYSKLQVECQENGWSCELWQWSWEIGTKGVKINSLIEAAATTGMRGRAQKKLVSDVGMEA